MIEDYIRYDQLVDKAMREVVKEALKKVKQDGFSGNHHFLISFLTGYEGVSISPKLKEKYPYEMTVVLQHQYEDLKITEDNFQVVLSFDGVKEKVQVPFLSLTSFADPGVKFGLKFNILTEDQLLDDFVEELAEEKSVPNPDKEKGTNKAKEKSTNVTMEDNVVTLKNFRKKEGKKDN